MRESSGSLSDNDEENDVCDGQVWGAGATHQGTDTGRVRGASEDSSGCVVKNDDRAIHAKSDCKWMRSIWPDVMANDLQLSRKNQVKDPSKPPSLKLRQGLVSAPALALVLPSTRYPAPVSVPIATPHMPAMARLTRQTRDLRTLHQIL